MSKLISADGKELEVSISDEQNIFDLVKANLGDDTKRVIAARADGQLYDISTPAAGFETIELIYDDDNDITALEILRHSCSHLLAQAVCQLYGPEVKYSIGPALVNDFKYGFYYDFDLPEPIGTEELPKIEKLMNKLAKKREFFQRSELSYDEAKKTFEEKGQSYKIELIDDLIESAPDGKASLYKHGDFTDLCRGPHLPHTSFIKNFKLQAVAGAYWRGDAQNKMLTRIYGVAFFDKENLEKHMTKVEEAAKRDHRLLGKQLDLYSISERIGPGMILWHPKGAQIRQIIERFWLDEHAKRGYEYVYTPHIAHEDTYITSGHLEAYSDMMYAPIDVDNQNYRVKPMNCPAHIEIYNSKVRSYRDLPIRHCELGTVYRYEPTGTLHGMLRVRAFTQDDSHIYCTIEQLADEVAGIMDLVDFLMKTFGYEYKVFLATRPEKSIGTEEEWQWSTDALKKALETNNTPYTLDEGGGAFYAPKIDIKLLDSLGREWQGPTIQVDLNLPKRFNCTYIGADNAEHRVVMVHRAVLGSMERFVGGLIEHYAGAFPTWLSPVQVMVLPVSEKYNEYGKAVMNKLRENGFRVKIDDADDKIGAKIRRATMEKTPYMLIVGQQEQESGQVSIRSRKEGQLGAVDTNEFIAKLKEEVDSRSL